MPGKYKAILLSLTLSLYSITLFSQISEKRKEVAAKFVRQADLVMESTAAKEVAKELYIQAARIDPDNVDANFKAGKMYLETINKDRAATYFIKVLNLNSDYKFSLNYLIGRSYHFGLDFDEAIKYYQKYEEKLAENPTYSGSDKIDAEEVKNRILECYNGKEFVSNPQNYSIRNMGAQINSVYDDYAPVINRENSFMIFTTRRKDGNLSKDVDIDNEFFEDIFFSNFEDGKWSQAKNIGTPINTVFHNSNLSLSADGNILFLYTDENNGDILVSNKAENGTWTEPESIGPNINSLGFKESSVCLSPDGSRLYFSSNRPGGYGGSDIYYSEKDKKGAWKKAKNLGSVINTKYDDDGPFVDFSGDYFYFSSKGHKGMGGYDIFKSEYLIEEESWGEPVNMGYPINTSDNDIYFVSSNDGEIAYYATVRGGGYGLSDIYSIKEGQFEIPEESDSVSSVSKDTTSSVAQKAAPEKKNVILNLRIKDQSGELMNAKVSLINVDNQIVAAQRKMDDGVYKFKVENPDNSTYRLSVEKDGFAFINEDILFDGSEDEITQKDKEIVLSPLSVGTTKVLRNIYFDFDKSKIKSSSFDELSKVENMLARNPSLEIELGGHTDNIGKKEFNKRLSKARVDAVKNYLINKGVDPRRITTVGYGEEQPLATNDDEKEGRELNRRVEFKVLKQ
ncbi:OmpA family protein [Hyphobacterium sp. CCMP332]|nr:OmpA family protein [Hyphobacterium sp. CCMP332]